MTIDMTRGKPLKLLITFALPLMLSSLLQQVYTMCDSIIVGRLLSTEAFAAIGSCSYLNWFPLSMILGCTQGFGVVLSQRFGADDKAGFRRALTMSTLLTCLVGLAVSLAGTAFLGPFLRLLKTPEELMGDSLAYLRVMWAGLLLTAFYNVVATALRAMGDSRSPFVALIFSTALNIALDFLLMAVIRMGVAGAALATLISQLVAVLYCCARMRKYREHMPARRDWRWHGPTARELLRLGVPQLLCFSVTNLGELAVTAAFNACGVVFVTGMMASRRYFELLTIVGNGLEGAVATFVGQNAGAKKGERIIEGTRTAVRLGIASSVTLGVLVALFARPLILLFVPNGTEEMIRIGMDALRVEALFVVFMYVLCEFRAAIQGMGNAIVPMLSGFLELAMRLLAVAVLPLMLQREGLYFTDAVTWVVTAAMLTGYYRHMRRKMCARMAAGQEAL